jgi:hypothetical protein
VKVFIRRQSDHSDTWALLDYLTCRFGPIHDRHVQIDYRDVWPKFQTALDGRFAVLGLAHYFYAGATLQKATQ